MNYRELIFYCILFFVFADNCSAENPWRRITSPVTTSLFNCVFTDSLNGWAAGEEGVIIHTSNGGESWNTQTNPVNFYINDIWFINKRLGWAVSNEFFNNGSTILKTTNGGILWTAESFLDSTVFLKTIYFLDSLNGFLGGFLGKIYKTTNAGASWIPTQSDTSGFSYFPVTKIRFLDSQTGFGCGGILDIAGVIWKTTNSGLYWTAGNNSPEPFYGIYLKNYDNLFAVGGDFEYGAQIVRSSDTGLSWDYHSLELFGQAQSIDFRTQNEAWMPLGFSATWAVSYDSGNTWLASQVTDNLILNSVDFSDSLHGWAVGNSGAILKYYPEPVNIINENNTLPETAVLFQNYPNPFNPKTIINYELHSAAGGASYVLLKVFDVLGKEVAVLVNEKMSPGRYEVKFDGSNLISGVYFYKLQTEGFSETKRMILLK